MLKGKCKVKDLSSFLDDSFTFTFQKVASGSLRLAKEVVLFY